MVTIAHLRRRRRRLEWALLACALMALVAWLSTADSLGRVNHLVQDAGMRLVSRPAHPDIVIVAIDDASIAAIGRWPWRRALHAELISRLTAQNPRAIGMDVMFNEADLDYPEDDLLLTDAIRRSARVVLPVLRRGYGPVSNQTDLPWPAFAEAAAGLGHVHVAPDSDGVVRSLYLLEGPAAAPLAPLQHRAAVRGRLATCGHLRPPAAARPPAPATPVPGSALSPRSSPTPPGHRPSPPTRTSMCCAASCRPGRWTASTFWWAQQPRAWATCLPPPSASSRA